VTVEKKLFVSTFCVHACHRLRWNSAADCCTNRWIWQESTITTTPITSLCRQYRSGSALDVHSSTSPTSTTAAPVRTLAPTLGCADDVQTWAKSTRNSAPTLSAGCCDANANTVAITTIPAIRNALFATLTYNRKRYTLLKQRWNRSRFSWPDQTSNVINVPIRPAGQPVIIVSCRPLLDRPVDWQNLQNLEQILSCQTWNTALGYSLKLYALCSQICICMYIRIPGITIDKSQHDKKH